MYRGGVERWPMAKPFSVTLTIKVRQDTYHALRAMDKGLHVSQESHTTDHEMAIVGTFPTLDGSLEELQCVRLEITVT